MEYNLQIHSRRETSLIEKRSELENMFELTTPTLHISLAMALKIPTAKIYTAIRLAAGTFTLGVVNSKKFCC